MWIVGYTYSWRKMEAAAQVRCGWRQVVSPPIFLRERQGKSQSKSQSPERPKTNEGPRPDEFQTVVVKQEVGEVGEG